MHAGGWCSEEQDGGAERRQVEVKAKLKRKKTIDIELSEIEPLVHYCNEVYINWKQNCKFTSSLFSASVEVALSYADMFQLLNN